MHPQERRASRRSPVRLYINKYIDGAPYVWEAVELSMSGALLRKVSGPDAPRASYALELASSAQAGEASPRLWLCATPVWSKGPFEALRFIGQTQMDRLRLADMLGVANGETLPEAELS